jgi:hypothetical protein
MCQMCDEYEAELIRMGLIAEAQKVRAERHGEQKPPVAKPVRAENNKAADARR